MPDGVALNRYWDDLPEPRPESYRADFELGASARPTARATASTATCARRRRAGGISPAAGCAIPADLRTLETTELVPVDLNSLLYNAERTIAALRSFRKQPGDSAVAARFTSERGAPATIAARRRVRSDATDSSTTSAGAPASACTDRPTMAAASRRSTSVWRCRSRQSPSPRRLEHEFLEPGGFVTTQHPLGPAVGRAKRLGAARVDGDRGPAPLRRRDDSPNTRARSLAGAQSAHVSRDRDE